MQTLFRNYFFSSILISMQSLDTFGYQFRKNQPRDSSILLFQYQEAIIVS